MSNEVQQIIASIVVLVTFLAVYAMVLYIVYWFSSKFIKWIYAIPWVKNQFIQTKEAIQLFWRKNSQRITDIWGFFSQILIDPIFYGYALVAVYDRMQSINEYVQTHPGYNFLSLLDKDMNIDTNFYSIFLLIFTIWMISKSWKHNQDMRERKAILKVLKNIGEKLGCNEPLNIGLINKEIREHLKRIREK